MTNTELIQKIRKWIEDRINTYTNPFNIGDMVNRVKASELKEFNSFLSTLEKSERPEPYNPVYDEAYLNEKIKKATESWKGVDVDAMLAECRGYDEEKSEKPMQEGLEEEMDKFFETMPVLEHENIFEDTFKNIARHFAQWGADHTPLPEDTVIYQKGVAEGKRLMMEDAVEGTVTCHNLNRYILVSGLDESFRYGDKVRVIICKKED